VGDASENALGVSSHATETALHGSDLAKLQVCTNASDLWSLNLLRRGLIHSFVHSLKAQKKMEPQPSPRGSVPQRAANSSLGNSLPANGGARGEIRPPASGTDENESGTELVQRPCETTIKREQTSPSKSPLAAQEFRTRS